MQPLLGFSAATNWDIASRGRRTMVCAIRLAAICALICPRVLLAEPSIHNKPVGTLAEGTFILAGKVVPLPDGKFELVAARERATPNAPTGNMLRPTSNIAEVVLVQTEGTT